MVGGGVVVGMLFIFLNFGLKVCGTKKMLPLMAFFY